MKLRDAERRRISGGIQLHAGPSRGDVAEHVPLLSPTDGAQGGREDRDRRLPLHHLGHPVLRQLEQLRRSHQVFDDCAQVPNTGRVFIK